MKPRVTIIGAGFGGLTSAALLAKNGYEVVVYEKNSMCGGRAIVRNEKGFKFDMGPSWYMMPEIFEEIFTKLDRNISDYYELEKLTPTYKAMFDDESFDVYSDVMKNKETFERLERGSFQILTKILKQSEFIYKRSTNIFLKRYFNTFFDYIDIPFIKKFLFNKLFLSYKDFINSKFKNKKLRDILSWHSVFVGGTPQNIPAIFTLMLYVDFVVGTFYPKNGGMSLPAIALETIAKEYGAKFFYNSNVEKINVVDKKVSSIIVNGEEKETEILLSNADLQFTESIIDKEYRQYNEKYWDKREMSPSTFLIFLGLNKKIDSLKHHNYYFSKDSEEHFKTMSKGNHKWPNNPSYYISCPSKSDDKIAPQGKENIMILVPVAYGLEDTKEIRDEFEEKILTHFEGLIGENIRDSIEVKFNYAHNDFVQDYNAFKGNAFGLANTFFQTGSFRPKIKSSKINNLYFTGTTTLPGIGVPLALISGEIASNLIINEH